MNVVWPVIHSTMQMSLLKTKDILKKNPTPVQDLLICKLSYMFSNQNETEHDKCEELTL